ncbi:MAG: hypothetical protein MI725_18100, partial [Pirellulales bacterium]|nr:hypothetical protein [Pirellulales bacterium]
MSMPLSPTRLFVCDGCQATLAFDEERVGQKCRCGRCGKILTMPGQPEEEKPQTPPQFSFACRLCETRLVASPKDVGRKAKCPDCGTYTKVPSPPKPRPKQVPRAMHGQQYG